MVVLQMDSLAGHDLTKGLYLAHAILPRTRSKILRIFVWVQDIKTQAPNAAFCGHLNLRICES